MDAEDLEKGTKADLGQRGYPKPTSTGEDLGVDGSDHSAEDIIRAPQLAQVLVFIPGCVVGTDDLAIPGTTGE